MSSSPPGTPNIDNTKRRRCLLTVIFIVIGSVVVFFNSPSIDFTISSSILNSENNNNNNNENNNKNHPQEETEDAMVYNPRVPTPFPNPPTWTFSTFQPPKFSETYKNDPLIKNYRIGLTTLMKKEHNYVSDWVKYHLAMGFDRIVLYDNEAHPTYADLLRREGLSCCVTEIPLGKPLSKELRNDFTRDETKVIVKHMPTRILPPPIFKKIGFIVTPQEYQMDDFTKYHLRLDGYTHASCFDIDEYLQLNKYADVREFAKYTLSDEYGVHPTCASVNYNWAMFGDNGMTTYAPQPVPVRFTCRGAALHHNQKQFYRTDKIKSFWVHNVQPKKGFRMCTTHNDTVVPNSAGHLNSTNEVAQLNHYQSKTWVETKQQRSRGRAHNKGGQGLKGRTIGELAKWFDDGNRNEKVDLGARNFFLKHVWKMSDEEIQKQSVLEGEDEKRRCPLPKVSKLEEIRRRSQEKKNGEK